MKNKSYQTNLTSFYEISRSIKVMMFDVIYTELHKANDLVLYGIWIKKIECNKVKATNGFQLVSNRTSKTRNAIAGKHVSLSVYFYHGDWHLALRYLMIFNVSAT